jgi:hypothetical protein
MPVLVYLSSLVKNLVANQDLLSTYVLLERNFGNT